MPRSMNSSSSCFSVSLTNSQCSQWLVTTLLVVAIVLVAVHCCRLASTSPSNSALPNSAEHFIRGGTRCPNRENTLHDEA